jgi:hypothetical protein
MKREECCCKSPVCKKYRFWVETGPEIDVKAQETRILINLAEYLDLRRPEYFFALEELNEAGSQDHKSFNIPMIAGMFAKNCMEQWPAICENLPAARNVDPSDMKGIQAAISRALATEAVTILIEGIRKAAMVTGCWCMPHSTLGILILLAFDTAVQALTK